MRTTVIIDNPGSWFVPYGQQLVEELATRGHTATLVHEYEDIPEGDVLFLLGCMRIVSPEILKKNTHNIVIHASKLPEGRGFAPLIWGILEGQDDIWVTAFEAVETVDAGDIYFQEPIHFEGHELHDEMRDASARKVIELALRFIEKYPAPGKPQEGPSTWYRRRTPKDGELDPTKTLVELFNQLRVGSNEHYPSFFKHKGHTYILKIEKKKEK